MQTVAKKPLVHEVGRSPWGAIQECSELAPGIWSVSTASHGGIKLDRNRQASMPADMKRPGGWYEEDCEWCLPFCIFADDLATSFRISEPGPEGAHPGARRPALAGEKRG